MNLQNDKLPEDSVKQINIFRSYFKTGELLSSDAERGRFYSGILRYGFSNGEIEPDFSDNALLQVAWLNIRPTIDVSLHNRRPGNKNANKTRMEHDSNANGTRRDMKVITRRHPMEKEKDKEMDMDDNSAPAETLFPNDSIIQSSIQPGGNFKKWTAEQFARSIDEAIKDHPEYEAFREDFARYWQEPDGRGRPKFQLQQTWSTTGRLATWARNNAGFGKAPTAAAVPSEDEQLRRIQRGY